MSSGAYWRCVPCGADVRFGEVHACAAQPVFATGANADKNIIRGARSPFPATEYAAHEVGKE